MKELAAKISGSELEVMEVLWGAGVPLPISAVRSELEEQRGWGRLHRQDPAAPSV